MNMAAAQTLDRSTSSISFRVCFGFCAGREGSQVACPLRHVASMTASLYAVRSWAMRPARVIVVFILSVMSWLHLLLGRPLVLFPCTCPSNISFSSPSCLFTLPKYFSFLDGGEEPPLFNIEFLQYGVVCSFFRPWHPQDCSVAFELKSIYFSFRCFIYSP